MLGGLNNNNVGESGIIFGQNIINKKVYNFNFVMINKDGIVSDLCNKCGCSVYVIIYYYPNIV